MKLKESVNRCSEKFSEAWLACLLMMVQGNLAAVTLKHAYIAAKTGTLTAVAFFIAGLCTKKQTVYADVFFTGMVTSVADIIIHPTHFGTPETEAILTGMGAALLALLLHLIKRK